MTKGRDVDDIEGLSLECFCSQASEMHGLACEVALDGLKSTSSVLALGKGFYSETRYVRWYLKC